MSEIHNTSIARQSIWPIRVYYEDTDAGGVVYHANYLCFCERARTESLRAQGIDQGALRAEHGIVFVVSRIEADFLKPAELDDMLQVITTVISMGAATVRFKQRVMRAHECLFEASVTIACVNWDRQRAVRIPDFLRNLLESEA
jgi:acyl-CoA thioester hydrolase